MLTLGLVVLISTLPAERPPLATVTENLTEPQKVEEAVQLVLYEADADERAVERPQYVDIRFTNAPNRRAEAVVAALRERGAQSVWPAALPLPTVFTVEVGSGRQIVVLDFVLSEPVPLSAAQEERLLESLQTTLVRNGLGKAQILINGDESVSFLGHVALESLFY